LNQQKFNAALADAVTNRSHLLASRRKPRRLRLYGPCNPHCSRVRDAVAFWLEQAWFALSALAPLPESFCILVRPAAPWRK
jgi:hypothetical protein